MEAVQQIKGAIEDEENHTCSDNLLQPPSNTCKFGTGTCRFKQRGGDNRIRLQNYKENEINRGGTSVKTGDSTELGNWLMLASGSGILLLLLMGLRRRAEEENGEA